MCLSFPGKIVEIRDSLATVDYGADGVRQNVDISLVDAEIGNYIIVQGGFAIRILSQQEAEEALAIWKMVREEFQKESPQVETG